MNLYKQPCDSCGSSDAVTIYEDGHSHCYSCQKHVHKPTEEEKEELPDTQYFVDTIADDTPKSIAAVLDFISPVTNLKSIQKDRFVALPERALSKKTAEYYGVWLSEKDEYVFPYFSVDSKKHVANQFRAKDTKGFMVQGEYAKTGLFGQQLFPAGSAKQITVCEGAFDALAAFEMTGSKWPCVAVKSAGSAQKEVAVNFEYLNTFDKVVLCFDKDDEHKSPDGLVHYPGQEAAQKVAAMFPLGKVRLMTLRKAKDANDYLKAGLSKEYLEEWWAAKEWTPVGLRLAKDMWEEVIKNDTRECIPYPWEGLNKLTYGIRTSEFVTITAFPGVGKTSVVREVVFNILQTILANKDDNRGVGLMMLEDSNRETLLGLMSLVANKPLHLPDVIEQVKEPELRKYFDAVYGDEKVVIWDHFGSNEIEKVLSFVRYMHNLGCKYIILDHLSIVVSDQSGDERKQLDEISTKLKTLCMELGIALIAVIHQNRKGEIRGTMGVEQLSNIVIKLYRELKSDDEDVRNTTKVTVEKNRFCGRTGPACLLKYDSETGRLSELPEQSLSDYLEAVIKKEEFASNDW